MGKQETYNELIFQLGDLARDELVKKERYPKSMDRVFKAEEVVARLREEMKALEDELNEEDAAYQEMLAAHEEERGPLQETMKRYHKAIEAIQGRSKDLRKKIQAQKAAIKYDTVSFGKAEQRHHDLELSTTDEYKLDESKGLVKRLRLQLMRRQRDLEELEIQFNQLLSPQEGTKGAPGVLAHKRMMEMEMEAEQRKEALDALTAEIDQAIAEKEAELQAAEDFLDQAIFLLGEDCYQQRIPEPALAALYPKIDRTV
jgi:chromosome segregation ATPase